MARIMRCSVYMKPYTVQCKPPVLHVERVRLDVACLPGRMAWRDIPCCRGHFSRTPYASLAATVRWPGACSKRRPFFLLKATQRCKSLGPKTSYGSGCAGDLVAVTLAVEQPGSEWCGILRGALIGADTGSDRSALHLSVWACEI